MVVRRLVNRNAQLSQKEVLRNPLTGRKAVKRTRKKGHTCIIRFDDATLRVGIREKACSAPAPPVRWSDIDPTASLLTPTRTSHSIFLLPLLCLKTKKRSQFEADPLWKTKVSYPNRKEIALKNQSKKQNLLINQMSPISMA